MFEKLNSPEMDTPAYARAREDEILGRPPRIPPMDPSDYTDEAIEITNNLRIAFNRPPDVPPPEYVATVLRHPTLFRHHNALAVELVARGALPARDRELAVLRLAWLAQAPYEWGEHVGIGKRLGGLTDAEILQVIAGSTAPEWSERDRAIIRSVEELLSTATISDETFAILSAHLDERQLLELPILLGQYIGVAFVQNAMRMRLIEGNPGLAAR